MIQDTAGNNKEVNEMVITISGFHRFYMHGFLRANLDVVKHDVERDYDAFIIVTGREGFGKSTLAMQIAVYLDDTFNLDRCCFTDTQFMEAVDNAKQYQAIVFDETMGYLSSRGTMSKFNRALVKVMSEMRSKNLFVILCISNFFELDRYPAIHRSTGLIHIYKRGSFGSYDYNKKKELYIKGKKFYSYAVSPTFIGDFVKYFALPKEEYEKKKQEAISNWVKEREREKSVKRERDKLIVYSFDKKWADIIELSAITGLSSKEIRKIIGVGENL